MKITRTFLLIILLSSFLNCKTSVVENFYGKHPQFVKTIGVMTGVLVIPGLCTKAWLGKRCTLSEATLFIPTVYFAPDEGTAKEKIGQFLGLLPIVYILSRSYERQY